MKHLIEKYENKIQQLKRASIEDPTGLIAQRIADFKEFIQDLKQEPIKLKKEDVCVYVEDEEHLEEIMEFLESKGELIGDLFILSISSFNYAQFCISMQKWNLLCSDNKQVITTEQFKKLWE